MKDTIANLKSDQLRKYLKDGKLKVGNLNIESGWLRVEKLFKDKYTKSKEYACASGGHSSVLLVTTMDDNLIRMGHTREITNRIQKTRKSLGIQIDDQIEVFYKSSNSSGLLADVAVQGANQVKKIIKMPYAPAEEMQKQSIPMGEATYENPEDPTDVVTLFVCKPAAIVDMKALQKSFGGDSAINLDSVA